MESLTDILLAMSRESFGASWNKTFKKDGTAFELGDEYIPEDLDAKIPDVFKEPVRPPIRQTLYRDPQDVRAIGRRGFLKKLAETGLAVGASAVAPSLLKGSHHAKHEAETKTDQGHEKHAGGRKVRIETGAFRFTADGKVRKVGSLFALYLGLKAGDEVPPVLEVDFAHVLDHLWDVKMNFVRNKIGKMKEDGDDPEKIQEIEDRIPNLLEAKKEITTAYREKWMEEGVESLSLQDVSNTAQKMVDEINAKLDWAGLNGEDGPFPQLSDNAMGLVQQMAHKVNGRMILTYSLTELMPALTDADMNADEYEFLLKHAGAEFLLSAPAMGDHWLSFGMLQFTSLALRDDGEKTEGASKVNKYLPEANQIEGSVKYATSLESQLKAGHMFAIYNMGLLIKNILQHETKDEQIHILTVLIEKLQGPQASQKALLLYMAAAHHSPGHAIQAFKKWLRAGGKGKLSIHADDELKPYIVKSGYNYDELKERLA